MKSKHPPKPPKRTTVQDGVQHVLAVTAAREGKHMEALRLAMTINDVARQQQVRAEIKQIAKEQTQ